MSSSETNAGGWKATIRNVTLVCRDKLERKGDPWRGENAVIAHDGRTIRIGTD